MLEFPGTTIPDLVDATPEASVPAPPRVDPETEEKKKVVKLSEIREALKHFYGETQWTAEDQWALFQKRGIAPDTTRAFGLRSNRPENEAVLAGMIGKWDDELLLRAGLVERVYGEDGDIRSVRPSRNLCGFGEIAKVKLAGRARGAVEAEMRNRYRMFEPLSFWLRDYELHVVGMNRAPIIPYFDYIPEQPQSNYDLVVVTEGEFKAMALWQTYAIESWAFSPPDPNLIIGIRTHKMWGLGVKPDAFMTPSCRGVMRWKARSWRIGVVAVPGIQFVKLKGETWKVAHEVREFITRNGATHATVVFDNEEKGWPQLPGYQPNVERRFDAVAYGLFLARDFRKQKIHGHFAMIPDEHRDAKGKADFDGAISAMLHGGGH